jgi:hypothetical protein
VQLAPENLDILGTPDWVAGPTATLDSRPWPVCTQSVPEPGSHDRRHRPSPKKLTATTVLIMKPPGSSTASRGAGQRHSALFCPSGVVLLWGVPDPPQEIAPPHFPAVPGPNPTRVSQTSRVTF